MLEENKMRAEDKLLANLKWAIQKYEQEVRQEALNNASPAKQTQIQLFSVSPIEKKQESLSDLWNRVCTIIRKKSVPTSALLGQQAECLSYENDQLTVSMLKPFKDQFDRQEDKMSLLKTSVASVFGEHTDVILVAKDFSGERRVPPFPLPKKSDKCEIFEEIKEILKKAKWTKYRVNIKGIDVFYSVWILEGIPAAWKTDETIDINISHPKIDPVFWSKKSYCSVTGALVSTERTPIATLLKIWHEKGFLMKSYREHWRKYREYNHVKYSTVRILQSAFNDQKPITIEHVSNDYPKPSLAGLPKESDKCEKLEKIKEILKKANWQTYDGAPTKEHKIWMYHKVPVAWKNPNSCDVDLMHYLFNSIFAEQNKKSIRMDAAEWFKKNIVEKGKNDSFYHDHKFKNKRIYTIRFYNTALGDIK